METLKIEQVYPSKNGAQGVYYPAKANGQTYNFDHQVNVGDTVQCDVRNSTYTNRQGGSSVSRWAKITLKGKEAQSQEHQNGKKHLNQFEFAEALDFFWDKLKAWEMTDDAKASVLCTCLIATADGRIVYEFPPDEVNPFADGE